MARKLPLGVAVIMAVAVVGSMGVARAQVPGVTPSGIVSVSVDPSILWPPNHKMREVTIEVEDELGPLEFIILGVTSDEPVTGIGDTTEPDWVVYGDNTLELRAERLGDGDGRTYTITIEVDHGLGVFSEETVEVVVPHDKGQRKGLLHQLKAERKAAKAAAKALRKAEKAALKAARKAEKEALKAARRAGEGHDDGGDE